MLLLLLLLPIGAVAYMLLERRRSRYAIRFTNVEVLASVLPSTRPWRIYVPPVLFLLSLAALIIALARPQVSLAVARDQASIVLAVDTSGSMYATDVKPTRHGAAQDAVSRFVRKLPSRYQVGLIAFSSEPQVAVPLTHDHELIVQSVNYFYPGAGTAIGDAIARAVDLLRPVVSLSTSPTRERKGPLAAILLLSDGAQTRGILQPLDGAARAKRLGIPIFTVALGTPNGTVTFDRGPFARTIPVPPDPVTLRQIASTTGGEFFAAYSRAKLNDVYSKLASRFGSKHEWREATFGFLGGGAVLLLLATGLSIRWLSRLP
jgi:Ca-activated chloride channel family protein